MLKQDILQRVSSYTKGEASVPSGDELDLWSEFLEDANQEWPNAIDPQALIAVHRTTMLQSGTSVALPETFKEKFAGFIDILGERYNEISPQYATNTSGEFVQWGGNRADGYYLQVSRARYSTSAVTIPFHSRPSSLTTLTSLINCPDPEFLVARTTEKVLMQRGQTEYQEFQQRADLLLQRMAANQVSGDIQRNNTIRTSFEMSDFTIGED